MELYGGAPAHCTPLHMVVVMSWGDRLPIYCFGGYSPRMGQFFSLSRRGLEMGLLPKRSLECQLLFKSRMAGWCLHALNNFGDTGGDGTETRSQNENSNRAMNNSKESGKTSPRFA